MEIITTYMYKTKDGITGYACGFEPQDVEIEKTVLLLRASEGKELQNKETGVKAFAITLKDVTEQDDYVEVDIEE